MVVGTADGVSFEWDASEDLRMTAYLTYRIIFLICKQFMLKDTLVCLIRHLPPAEFSLLARVQIQQISI